MVHVYPESKRNDALTSLYIPQKASHKGMNGKLLIIGGSALFHAPMIWAASTASRIVDMVHYASTKENNEIFSNLKSKFVDGIVVSRENLLDYVEEDDCILIGPGMLRGTMTDASAYHIKTYEDVCGLQNDYEFTYYLTKYLLTSFPRKRFVLDAGVLQMMDKAWLQELKTPSILTPHMKEFEQLFGKADDNADKMTLVRDAAKTYNCTILLKNIVDQISNGKESASIEGGNAGLAKGGTGDVLAGITASFYCKSDSMTSCITASYLLKQAAEDLYKECGMYFNTSELVVQIGKTAKNILFDK